MIERPEVRMDKKEKGKTGKSKDSRKDRRSHTELKK